MSTNATTPLELAPLPEPGADRPAINPVTLVLADSLRDSIWTAAATSSRSLQADVGFSGIGKQCERELAYGVHGVAPVNFPDPLRTSVGSGVHLQLADYFRRLDGGTNRYLVEVPVRYRGVRGTCDLYDRRRRVVIDWKTTTLAKVRVIRRNDPPKSQVTQVQGYGAALRQAGEDVAHVAIAYVPLDGQLADIYVWTAPADSALADAAIDRLNELRDIEPRQAVASPSRLCPWCPWFRAGSLNASVACHGNAPAVEITTLGKGTS